MRGRRWFERGLVPALVLTAVLALTVLWLGALRSAAPAPDSSQAQRPLWVLRELDGQLAQYDADAPEGAAPLQVWQVYTALLPRQDAQRLRSGIPVYSSQQLRVLVEDLGG